MSEPAKVEEPCDDGKPCDWACEEVYAENGELESWDLYCTKCGRDRDWTKDEMPDDAPKA